MKGEEWSGVRTQRSGVKYRFTRLGVKEHSSVTSERVNRYVYKILKYVIDIFYYMMYYNYKRNLTRQGEYKQPIKP